jgi:hypothetical protein
MFIFSQSFNTNQSYWCCHEVNHKECVFFLVQPICCLTYGSVNCFGLKARLSLDTQHKSLIEVAHQLNAKANLLDSAQLDHIEGRLTALAQKMDSVNEKSAATPEDAERNQKVCSSYAAHQPSHGTIK